MTIPARRVLLTVLLIFLTAPAWLGAREAHEQARIEHLLVTIGGLQNATFIRNGTAYDAATAEKHLRGKLDYAGERLKTAEQFIEYCATKSSLSGQPYQIKFSNGENVAAAQFLRGKLAEYDRTAR